MKIEDKISGKTKIIGIIGNPVEHSISPQIQNTISRCMGINAVYIPFRVDEDELESAVKGVRALNITGFNVTKPFKNQIMKYIDTVSNDALLMGAINCVKNVNGRLYGYNTDAEGFYRSFTKQTGTGFIDKSITLLGAGGAARAIAVKIAAEGAKRISIINRTLSKACDIAEIVNNNFGRITDIYELKDAGAEYALKQSDIVINTTSAGMYPDIDGSPLDESIRFRSNQIIYDIIYNPPKTRFLANAQKTGALAVNGSLMLLYQGVYAYEIWMDIKLPQHILDELSVAFSNYLKK